VTTIMLVDVRTRTWNHRNRIERGEHGEIGDLKPLAVTLKIAKSSGRERLNNKTETLTLAAVIVLKMTTLLLTSGGSV
jgi:hypothetical protein